MRFEVPGARIRGYLLVQAKSAKVDGDATAPYELDIRAAVHIPSRQPLEQRLVSDHDGCPANFDPDLYARRALGDREGAPPWVDSVGSAFVEGVARVLCGEHTSARHHQLLFVEAPAGFPDTLDDGHFYVGRGDVHRYLPTNRQRPLDLLLDSTCTNKSPCLHARRWPRTRFGTQYR